MVVIPEADADGAAGSGQDSCHGVQVDHHICYSLQDELLVHYGLRQTTLNINFQLFTASALNYSSLYFLQNTVEVQSVKSHMGDQQGDKLSHLLRFSGNRQQNYM